MTERLTLRLARPLRAVAATGPAAAQRPAPEAGGDADAEQARARAEQALAAEREALSLARNALTDAAEKLDRLHADLAAGAEAQLLDLSLEIARKVLMQEIQAERHEIDPIVKEALGRVPPRQEVVVHLHPDDLRRSGLAEAEGAGAETASVRFTADPSVARAGCVIETSEGIVESSPEMHLAEIGEALKGGE
jgi:flagellar assembly protein FliH